MTIYFRWWISCQGTLSLLHARKTNWYWKQYPLQQTIIVPTHTILYPSLYVITIRHVQDTHNKLCSRNEEKNQYKDIQLLWLMLIMIIFWMKLSVVKKMTLKGMWMLIVMRNSIGDNNNNSIFDVIFCYIIIKYQYVNVIWSFICSSVFILLLYSVIFILF